MRDELWGGRPGEDSTPSTRWKLTAAASPTFRPTRPLIAKIERSKRVREGGGGQPRYVLFGLEDPKQGLVRGTCQVFGQVVVVQPFYSIT